MNKRKAAVQAARDEMSASKVKTPKVKTPKAKATATKKPRVRREKGVFDNSGFAEQTAFEDDYGYDSFHDLGSLNISKRRRTYDDDFSDWD